MESRAGTTTSEMTALLIAPDRALAEQFTATLSASRAFQIVADLKTYPSQHTLEIRLRQVRPDSVLLDLGSDREAAAGIIRFVTGFDTSIQIVGLNPKNDPEVLLACLRLGASEFLYAPFDVAIQREAVYRLARLRQPDPVPAQQPGTVLVFASAKPGSGASTLAVQTAYSLQRETGKPVLLADFDLMGGTAGIYSRPDCDKSLLDALRNAGQLQPSLWSSLVCSVNGIDFLAAPDTPWAGRVDSGRLNGMLEHARLNYDWVLIDLPVIFQPVSLMVLSNADRAMLVSTTELPSLHLARKAVNLLERLGVPKDRCQVLLNRIGPRDEISSGEIQKVLNCPISMTFPNDFFSLNRAITLRQRLDENCALGQAIQKLTAHLIGARSIAPQSVQRVA